mmetsp:Transcript_8490/g.31980  ORF Transcript_8490/g.31980 Transcript_8490/m.31980 type:complete len:216 (-) Transcript_8490:49-696(-)
MADRTARCPDRYWKGAARESSSELHREYGSCLTVQTVVDAVHLVLHGGLEGDEAALVGLDHGLLGIGQARDAIQVRHALVRAVGRDLASHIGVHALDLLVHPHVGVVHINLLATAQVRKVGVVNHGVGSGARAQNSGGNGQTRDGLLDRRPAVHRHAQLTLARDGEGAGRGHQACERYEVGEARHFGAGEERATTTRERFAPEETEEGRDEQREQ